ncbi:hypothetical protein ACFVVX_01190 [Kitasatospora sp. NPDC058170]|uniref:hypothetical protein n=1 Tax=Kitasatospora sp. NPDC058170 TaxID=3346364 RepID=UPI0036D9EC4E
MRRIVAGQKAHSASEFAELALGVDTELFTGPAGPESMTDRAARLAAAGDILAVLYREDPELAAYAEHLMRQAEPKPVPAVRVPLLLLASGVQRFGKHLPATMFGQVAA